MRQSLFRGWVAGLAGAAFVWTLALAVSPGLHARVHSGQNRADHDCAVTFVRAGSYEYSTTPRIAHVANFSAEFTKVSDVARRWVPSPFLCGAVFEHAPPFFS